MPNNYCKKDGCDGYAGIKGLCYPHYYKARMELAKSDASSLPKPRKPVSSMPVGPDELTETQLREQFGDMVNMALIDYSIDSDLVADLINTIRNTRRKPLPPLIGNG